MKFILEGWGSTYPIAQQPRESTTTNPAKGLSKVLYILYK